MTVVTRAQGKWKCGPLMETCYTSRLASPAWAPHAAGHLLCDDGTIPPASLSPSAPKCKMGEGSSTHRPPTGAGTRDMPCVNCCCYRSYCNHCYSSFLCPDPAQLPPPLRARWLSHITPLMPFGLATTGNQAWCGAGEVGQSYCCRLQTPKTLHCPRSTCQSTCVRSGGRGARGFQPIRANSCTPC